MTLLLFCAIYVSIVAISIVLSLIVHILYKLKYMKSRKRTKRKKKRYTRYVTITRQIIFVCAYIIAVQTHVLDYKDMSLFSTASILAITIHVALSNVIYNDTLERLTKN